MRRPRLPAAALLFAAAPLFAFALVPIALLVGRAAVALGAGALDELLQPATADAVWGTLVTAAGAAGIAAALALPLAVLLARTDLPSRGALTTLFTLPTAIPPFIWAMGWIFLANPRTGLLNRWPGLGLDVYGRAGIAFVEGTAALPLVLLPVMAALARIDPSLEEAARVSGASAARALLAVPVRLALPALVSGVALVFLFAASAFGVPYLLGVSASPPVTVLTTRVYGLVLMGGPEHLARAVVLCGVLLGFATALTVLASRLGRSAQVAIAAGKGLAARPLRLGRARAPLAVVSWAIALTVVLLPLAAVLLASVLRGPGSPLQLDELTGSHWRAILAHPRTLQAARTSGLLALGSSVVICALGLAVALARRGGGRAGRAVELLATWPWAVPGTVLALALVVAFSHSLRLVVGNRLAFVLALGDSAWLLLVAYAGKYLALGSRTLTDALLQHDPSLPEAARVCGARPARAFLDVTLPALKAPLAGAFTLVFLLCATELTMSVLLLPTGAEVLGTLLFELQSYADPSAAAALACAFVGAVLALTALRAAWRRS